jgi:periplasmic copper chaperone A
MLMGLSGQVKGGDTVPLTLTFEDANKKTFKVDVQAPVTALGGNAAKPNAHGMKHMQ